MYTRRRFGVRRLDALILTTDIAYYTPEESQ